MYRQTDWQTDKKTDREAKVCRALNLLFFSSEHLHICGDRGTSISCCTSIDKHISLQGMGNVNRIEILATQTLKKMKKLQRSPEAVHIILETINLQEQQNSQLVRNILHPTSRKTVAQKWAHSTTVLDLLKQMEGGGKTIRAAEVVLPVGFTKLALKEELCSVQNSVLQLPWPGERLNRTQAGAKATGPGWEGALWCQWTLDTARIQSNMRQQLQVIPPSPHNFF